jgi:hypothetical protein
MESATNRHSWDVFWYVVIGLFVVLGIAAFVVWVPNGKFPSRKWAEFSFYSFMLFAFLSKIYWRYRSHLRLWLLLLGSLAAHVSVYLPILQRLRYSPTLWYAAMMPLEGMLIMLVLWLLLHIPPDANVRL